MQLKPDFFPYPVLSNDMDDFVNSKFNVDLEYTHESPTNIKLIAKFDIEDEKIKQLIVQNQARYALHIEGKSSSFRRLIKSRENTNEIKIDLSATEISGLIEVNMMVIANEKIEGYTNENFNPDYYGENYEVKFIEKGDILAFDTMATINLEFSNIEDLGAQSMIRVSGKDQKYMSVDTNGDVIHIYLPVKENHAYINLSKSNHVKEKLLLSTIVLPALTVVIERIKQNEISEDSAWFLTLMKILEKYGYLGVEYLKNRDSMEIAQQLLDFPFKDCLYDYYQWEESMHETY
ncbi:hypothetical protein [Mammaliicoccus lentus]|jgi:hypothetical protein|uniref:hypothetical protein n=1 Tax=Mammaliicoccus lentus TaxID=42858 RepID=UPI0035145075